MLRAGSLKINPRLTHAFCCSIRRIAPACPGIFLSGNVRSGRQTPTRQYYVLLLWERILIREVFGGRSRLGSRSHRWFFVRDCRSRPRTATGQNYALLLWERILIREIQIPHMRTDANISTNARCFPWTATVRHRQAPHPFAAARWIYCPASE